MSDQFIPYPYGHKSGAATAVSEAGPLSALMELGLGTPLLLIFLNLFNLVSLGQRKGNNAL